MSIIIGENSYVTLEERIDGNYTVHLTCNRTGYAGIISYSTIEKFPTYATIYYYAGDGASATFDWFITH